VPNNNVTATLQLHGQQQFASGMQRAETKTKHFGGSLRTVGFAGLRFGSGMAKASLGIAGLAAGVAAAGVAMGVGFIQDARESAKVAADTAATLKSTGNAARVTADHVGDLATAISNKTGMDDEAIQSGANMLLTFTKIRNEVGKGNDIFDQATTTVADLAAKMGTDPSKAAIQLGKALNDPVKGVTALTKVGVTFDAKQKATIKRMVDTGRTADAQRVILHELNKEFGGQAAAQHDGWDKLTTSLGNLREQIGGYLLPYVNKLGEWLSGPGFTKISGLIDRGAKSFGNLASRGLAAVMPYARDFIGWIQTLEPAVRDAGRYIREGMASGMVYLSRSFERNKPMLMAFYAGIKAAVPWVIRIAGVIGGISFAAIEETLGGTLDAIRIVSSGFLQLARGTLTALGWILHAAAVSFGWIPGLGPKLKAADRAFGSFKDEANRQLNKIEKEINLNVDTSAADRALRNWHPVIGRPYFQSLPVIPGVSSASAIASAGGGGSSGGSILAGSIGRSTFSSQTNVFVDSTQVAARVDERNRRTAVRR
jgi:hypothetical protein